jgi:hypothetical protein
MKRKGQKMSKDINGIVSVLNWGTVEQDGQTIITDGQGNTIATLTGEKQAGNARMMAMAPILYNFASSFYQILGVLQEKGVLARAHDYRRIDTFGCKCQQKLIEEALDIILGNIKEGEEK